MGRMEVAIRKQQEAHRLRADGRIHNSIAAARLESEASELLAPSPCEVSMGEAISTSPTKFAITDTLENPDCVSREASGARVDLLSEANCLELGLDTSESIGAKNSIERMLSHQAAMMHNLSMKFLARAADPAMPTVEAARLANSARSLIQTFSDTILTVQRLRTGGSQQIGQSLRGVSMETRADNLQFEGLPHARCGARTRQGAPCKNGRMLNGRCRMHGGLSTGPTEVGRQRISRANWKHGAYSREQQECRARLKQIQESNRLMLSSLKELARVNPEVLRRGGLNPSAVLRMKDYGPMVGEEMVD